MALPEVAQRLEELRHALEATFRDAQEFEFTVQDGRLYLLQTRSAKRTPWAALRMAVEQVREGLATPAQALARLDGIDLAAIERRRVADEGEVALASAQPASIGLAVGAIALDSKACKRLAAKGRPAILVRNDTSTEDIAGIAAAAGVLTARRRAHLPRRGRRAADGQGLPRGVRGAARGREGARDRARQVARCGKARRSASTRSRAACSTASRR